MAYIHCHSCDWSQDDFYHEDGYNPARYLLSWMSYLCGSKKDRLDDQFSDDAEFVREHGDVTTREVIATNFENFANRIRTMTWVTYEEWEKDPDRWICPKCKNKDLDID